MNLQSTRPAFALFVALLLGILAGSVTQAQEADQAVEDFDTLFTAWKQNLSDLRDLYQEYQTAEEDELQKMKQRWEALIVKGQEMVDPLRAAAIAKYNASPNADRQLTKFLVKLAADEIKHDDYATAREICEALVAGESDERELDNLTGIAAFGTNDFKLAETHLIEASRNGTLSAQGEEFMSSLADCQATWEEEVKLREAEAAADDLPRVKLITEVGDITLELFENEAPETVGNFISLAEKGFYDGLTFHRVMAGFMAQGGCPKGDGTGGPGYKIYCECLEPNHRKHFAGSLSMAKGPSNHSGGSQFFICFVPRPHLNGRHTVFGRVIEGMDVLPEIRKRDPEQAQALAQPTKIERVEVIRKRDHEYKPNKVK